MIEVPGGSWREEADRRIRMDAIQKEQHERFRACMLLAGFKVTREWNLVNGYLGWNNPDGWPPWYLMDTQFGLIIIGWRKRVISVDWASTGLQWERPVDPDVTRGGTYMHAYGYDKLLEYLRLLAIALQAEQGTQ